MTRPADPGHAREPGHARVRVDDQGIATLTITNARSLNVLSTPVIEDLRRALAGLRARDDVRVLIMRGSGEKAFIAGADIDEMAGLDGASGRAFISRLRALCDDLRDFPAPVIARLAGWCLGGGLEVALSCDLRIGGAGSRYGMPEVRLGIPSVIHAALLPRLIGASRATWLLLTGEDVDAATALDWGLIQKLAGPGELDAAVDGTARGLAALGPLAVRQQKRLLRSWEDVPLPQAMDESVTAFGEAFATGEPQRFMRAFRDRRR
ncbi:enoyl-CoA hydratase [Actinomadura sp. NPDC048394]|jgi:enoyl-CoA hydratase/carnithine racemase|uniref:enoyl-CoA hydratase n=1 Tax=Actinomadura sp. NPDC048394 TaxID=3158223 RepID=UPI0033E39395